MTQLTTNSKAERFRIRKNLFGVIYLFINDFIWRVPDKNNTKSFLFKDLRKCNKELDLDMVSTEDGDKNLLNPIFTQTTFCKNNSPLLVFNLTKRT